MSTPPSPPAPPRQGARPQPKARPQPRAARTGRLVVAGLLGVAALLALALLLTWPGAGAVRVRPSSAGSTHVPAASSAPTGPVVQATEVTATPSRGEPTDVVPFGTPSPGVPAPGTGVPNPWSPPTPTAQTGPAAVEITCAAAKNSIAGDVCVHTAPGTALTISVTYCNGLEARNVDLQGTRYADNYGNYTWSWVPETTCPGPAVVHVTANGTGGSSDASTTFTVDP